MGKVIFPGTFPFECDEPYLPQFFIFNSNLAQAMKMYWRVKTWEVRATLSGRTITPPDNGEYVFTYGWDVIEEKELVCLKTFSQKSGGSPFTENSFVLYPNTNSTQLACSILFRPSDDGGEPSVSSAAFPIVGKTPFELSILNFGDGGTCTLYNPNSTLEGYGSISIVIKALEYWSYDGTYNTTTGEPL
jgi:hypothetical protein